MKYKERILKIVLSFFSFFAIRIRQKENRITFITLESDKLENDFLLISEELARRGGYELKYHLIKYEKTILGNLKYLIACIYQLFLINSSKVVLLDFNNYVVSNFKRKEVKVIQVWHASGAIKKFGNMTQRDYVIKNYDFAICNAEIFRPIFSEAFNIPKENIISTGIPRTDVLFDAVAMEKNKEEIQKKYPEIKGKKVILYAPTFRGRLMEGLQGDSLDITTLVKKLPKEYVVMYKMHPLISDLYMNTGCRAICANHEELYKLFSVADCLISDYSAVIFDFTVLGRPIYFYAPDYKEYAEKPGFCIDYLHEIPMKICYNQDELSKQIVSMKYDMEALEKFSEKYFEHRDGESCKRVVDLIEKVVK